MLTLINKMIITSKKQFIYNRMIFLEIKLYESYNKTEKTNTNIKEELHK